MSAAASAANLPSSSLPELYENHHSVLKRLDDLEHRIASRVAAHRRRATNVLEETSHRRSHMRIFVSHRLDDESKHTEQKTTTVVPPPAPKGGKDFSALLSAAAAHHVLPQKKSIRKWTLVIEGGLLIKQLDHESAKEVDRRWDAGLPLLGRVSEEDAGDSLRASKYEIATRNLFQLEQEYNDNVKPLIFTHLFDKLEVEIKAVKKADDTNVAAPTENDGQPVKTFTWKRSTSSTPDSHAFFIVYNEEGRVPLTDPNEKEQNEAPKAEYDSDYISAQIKLYRREGKEEMYVPSDRLCEVFFPSFIGKKPMAQSKKRKAQDLSNEPRLYSDVPKDVVIPNTLTMDDILRSIFYYIRTRNLNDPTDLSVINFDDTLTELFGCNRMLLAELRKTLLEKELIVKVEAETHPIVLNYQMTLDGAEPLTEAKLSAEDTQDDTASADKPKETVTRTRSSIVDAGKEKDDPTEKQKTTKHQTMLSCDVDIEIPNIYHLRTRDILKRINHREHEYTSCRNKAKLALVATGISEEAAKLAIDDTITGSSLSPHLKQVWMALAHGSHEGGEAQRAALIELRTASLVEKLEERTAIAQGYWDIVEVCRNLSHSSGSNLSNTT